MALEETGVRLIIDGVEAFNSGMQESADSVDEFGETADSASEQSSILGDALDTLGGLVSGAFNVALGVGVAAIGGLAAGLYAVVPAALENEQTMARLESQLEATGGRAGLTMDDLTDLAASFQDLAGGTDDTVLAIESVGLKFSGITKDVMPQFIQSSLDLAAVMGTDETSAAQALGLALEDPAGALGRLRRAGIVFTDQEEDQIKAMVAAGDAASAQQLILDKLAGTVGGAAAAQAETLAGKWEIFTGRLGEAAETIGMGLLPILTSLFDSVIAPAIPLIEAIAAEFGAFISGLSDGSDLFSAIYDALVAAFGPETGAMLADVVGQIWDAIAGFIAFIQANMPLIQDTIGGVWAAVSEIFTAVSGLITGTVLPAFAEIFGSITTDAPTAQEVFTGVMTGIKEAAALVSAFIVDVLVPAFKAAVDWVVANWPTIRSTIEAVIDGIKWAVNNIVVPLIRDVLIPIFVDVRDWVQENWPVIQSTITTAVQNISDFVTSVMNALRDFWQEHGDAIMTIANAVWSDIYTIISTLITAISTIVTTVAGALQTFWQEWGDELTSLAQLAWDSITAIVTTATSAIGLVIEAIAAAIEGDWDEFGKYLRDAWDLVWSGAQTTLSNAYAALIEIAASIVQGISSAFTDTDWEAIGDSIIKGIKKAIKNGIESLANAAAEAAQAAYDAFMGALQGHSPSKLFEKAGKSMIDGAAMGIEKNMGGLQDAMDAMSLTASPDVGLNLDGGSRSAAGAAGGYSSQAMPVYSAAGAGGYGTTNNTNVSIYPNYSQYQEPPAIVEDFNLALAMM